MGKRTFLALAVAAAMTAAACERDDGADRVRFGDDEMERARAGWPAELAAAIDAGNAAYRAGRYDEAAGHYRRAAELDPQVGAAWFGLHMAELARGNTAAADSALLQAERVTPGLGTGHPETMPRELPEGHPPLQ